MKIKEIRANFSFTKNLGNFESVKVEAGVTGELESGEDVEEMFQEAFEVVKEEVRKHCKTKIK